MNDIVFILLGPIILGIGIGIYLDKALAVEIPVFTMVLTMLGIITGMYSVFKKYSK